MATGRQIMVRVSDELFDEIAVASGGNKQKWFERLIAAELHPERPAAAGAVKGRVEQWDRGRPAHSPLCGCLVCKPPKAAA